MSGPLQPDAIARVFHESCLAELDALKPGNVHRFGAGHGMSVADFERSAVAAAHPLTQAGVGVGTRIRLAVEATAAAVGQNTNLGPPTAGWSTARPRPDCSRPFLPPRHYTAGQC